MEHNRRRYIRITTDLHAEIQIDDSAKIGVTVVDLSEGGIKIDCDQEIAYALLPVDQRTPGPVYDLNLELGIELPKGSGEQIRCQCRVVFFHRLAQDHFQFGLQFQEVGSEDQRRIRHYIAEQLFSQAR